MLKQFSFLVILISSATVSCSTKNFSDIIPETKGTPLGNVTVGRENADYFVVPTRNADGEPDPTVVVFKTKERHPVYRAANLAGAPLRAVDRVAGSVVGGVTSFAGGVVTQPFQQQEMDPGLPATRSVQRNLAAEPHLAALPPGAVTEAHAPLTVPQGALAEVHAPVTLPQATVAEVHTPVVHASSPSESAPSIATPTATSPYRSTSMVLHRSRPTYRHPHNPCLSPLLRPF